MDNINSHINVEFFLKKLPGEAGNVPLVYNKYEMTKRTLKNTLRNYLDRIKQSIKTHNGINISYR